MNLRNIDDDYSIGLDLGTGSAGWAVIDSRGDLAHFKKHPTWGSRIFPTAETAASARANRGQRRRYVRRRWRLNLLQGLFAEQMAQVDPDFFIRLSQARLLAEDRDPAHSDYRWPLFNSKEFNESDYYKRYPTIYHLRAWLMETDEQADLRLIYLAFHNIVKTRGNFLHQDTAGLSATNANMGDAVGHLCDALVDWCDQHDTSCEPDGDALRALLEDPSQRRADKQAAAQALLGLPQDQKKTIGKAISQAIVGYVADFSAIFQLEGDQIKFALSNDDKVEEFLAAIPDEGMPLFDALREMYSSYVLLGILKGSAGEPIYSAALQGSTGRTISYCKVREYEQYKQDLKLLKELVRTYAPTNYNEFFRGEFYEGTHDYNPAKAKGYTLYDSKRGSAYDDFKKSVEKLLDKTDAADDPRYIQMMAAFSEQTFLRRLKTSDNGSIPFQLHLEEMDAIIKNQGRFYPFLLEERAKIESLVSFRIPYYVGPLTQKNAASKNGKLRFAWAERRPGMENEPVLPWNWDQVIDKGAAAQKFIERMTSDCTYLYGEPVLPKCSLLYEEFCVLNELNGARFSIDGDRERRFNYADRSDIVEFLFKHGRSVSYKKVEDWLRSERGFASAHVLGGQGEKKFESSMGSYIFFCKDIFGVDELPGSYVPMVEKIILWNTLFEDRSILKEQLKSEFGDVLSAEQVKKICKKRFTGWGRLSKKFLTGLKAQTDNGPMTIMDIMREGDPTSGERSRAMVLMEILHDERLGFEKLIEQQNAQALEGASGLTVDDLPGSPALRRTINQAIRIVDEIAGIAGKAPANIFIEVTRDEDAKNKGKRTKRRYDHLKEAVEAFKRDHAEGAELLRELKGLKPDELDDRLSLYFMQGGKSLYSGTPLDIRRLSDYEVDHIIPQSYIKDDSFENKALVLKEENQAKTDNLLISPSIRQRMAPYWRALHAAELIGDKKLNNLLCSDINERRIKGFVARQLVETSQSVKLVKMLLEEAYPTARVLPIKASLSHELRVAKSYYKCREINDFHHAHDALLAAEIGRFILLRHSGMYDNPIGYAHVVKDFVRSQAQELKKTGRMPGSAGFIVSSFMTSGFDKETGEIFKDTWDAEAECERIRRFLNYKQVYVSRMPEETSGAFWDATIYSPKDPSKKLSLPVKRGLDPAKYGGFSSKKFAYFFAYYAEDGRGKTLIDFAPVPVAVAANPLFDLAEYAETVAKDRGYKLVSIARSRISVKQLIEVDGCRLFITGADQVRSAVPIAFSQKETSAMIGIYQGSNLEAEEYKVIFEKLVKGIERFDWRLYQNLCLDSRAQGFDSIGDIEEKALVIKGLIALSSAKNNMADMRPIGGAKTAGQLKINYKNTLSRPSGIVFIDQSVTGMFEKRTRIGL